MINSILHPNKIIEGAHSPEIVLLLSPRCVKDRWKPVERRIRLFAYDLVSINDCENVILIKLVIVDVIHVAVESHDLYRSRSEILLKRSKPVDIIQVISLHPFTGRLTSFCSDFFEVVPECFVFCTILIVRHTFKHLLEFT